jgi:3'-phosphoadenosine 5'-phosphosulfate sulfotransferase (PAPS reductase)/FAD synthetase
MIKVVVPISGGKDSQACLKLALETYDKSEVLGLFCDTKFEHPLTYRHVFDIKEMYGIDLVTISAGNVPEKVLKYKRFPSDIARFCTDELKIIPSKNFYKKLAETQGGFQVWYGMRAGESSARAKRYSEIINTETYAPHEVLAKYPKYLHKLGVSFRLPILEWASDDVLDFLDGEQNQLYAQGFDRVGCFPCLASGDKWKKKAFNHDETGRKHFAIVQEIEKKIGKSCYTSKGEIFLGKQNDLFSGCAICAI